MFIVMLIVMAAVYFLMPLKKEAIDRIALTVGECEFCGSKILEM